MDMRDISVSPLEFGYPNYNQTTKWKNVIEGNHWQWQLWLNHI